MVLTSTIRHGRWKRRLIHGIALAFGLLAVGCRSNPNEPSLTSADAVWSATPPPRQETAPTGPPPVVFVEFVRTPQDVTDRMLRMARVTRNDVVCDLGCGDGRILITAAKRYGCRAIGYDLDPLRVQEARENAQREGVAHLVTVEQKDVLSVSLEGVSVVTVYLGTEINTRLIPQLSRLPAGARIVSHNFGLGSIRPDKIAEMTSREDDRRHRIYLWLCPLSRDVK